MPARKHGTTGLWLRGNTWWIAVTIPGFGRIRRSLGTSDIAEAVTRARAIKAEPARELSEPEERDSLTAFFAHLRRQGVSAGYCDVNQASLGKALREMGVDDAARVTSLTLRRWFAGHLGTDRERNAVQVLSRLSRLFRWLVQERRMPTNPADGIKPPKLPPRLRKRFLTREQADRLIATCADQRLKFALFCALHAGMRKGEIVASRPDWFDLQSGLLHIQNTEDWLVKDRTDRTVPLTAAFREFLAGYGLPSPYMLPSGKAGKVGRKRQRSKRGKPAPTTRYRYDFRRPFAEHMRAQGLDGFTFHDLRRTFASLLVSSGVSIYKVAKWLGDGVAVVEKRYGHLIPLDEDINAAWN